MGKNLWSEWIKFTNYASDNTVYELLEKAPKKLQELYALAISVAKWHPESGGPGGHPCGLCDYADIEVMECDQCCLSVHWKGIVCDDEDSPYWAYVREDWKANKSRNKLKLLKKKMFDDLMVLYTREWEKVYGKK